MSAITAGRIEYAETSHNDRAVRLSPWSGIAFVVLFIVGVVASSPPGTGASNAAWIANYSSSHDAGHIASGVCLALSGLAFLLFVVGLWHRIALSARARRRQVGPLALVGAGVTAACMGVGGALMAIPSVLVKGGAPVPSADLLRFCNDTGFAVVAIPGMLAAAIAVVALSQQGRQAALFGRKLHIYGIVVAVALLASIEFLPIALLLIWLIVVAVVQLRRPIA